MDQNRRELFPSNWQLLNHTATGEYHLSGNAGSLGNVAVFHVELLVRVFDNKWTTVPLLDSETIISEWHVTRACDGAALEDHCAAPQA
eukprot:4144854-Pyramimonas_sp.AAC.3